VDVILVMAKKVLLVENVMEMVRYLVEDVEAIVQLDVENVMVKVTQSVVSVMDPAKLKVLMVRTCHVLTAVVKKKQY
jgi:hypothetical protein